jgi:hypothetical protein
VDQIEQHPELLFGQDPELVFVLLDARTMW